MKIGKLNIRLHSISVHFTTALYPVALLFLLMSLFRERELMLYAYFHLMILATLSAPLSYLTGFIEWRQHYKQARVRIFIRKVRIGQALMALGALCTLWYGMYPDIMQNAGGGRILFLVLNAVTVPLVVSLGSLGGKLVFGSPH